MSQILWQARNAGGRGADLYIQRGDNDDFLAVSLHHPNGSKFHRILPFGVEEYVIFDALIALVKHAVVAEDEPFCLFVDAHGGVDVQKPDGESLGCYIILMGFNADEIIDGSHI